MTLEDFFTLTEMKDGLSAPGRVEELVAVMQKEKDYVVKNVGDATRQWFTVASTIAATENKDCLDLFIQLDGLWFIDRWLKDAQKFGNDTSDSFVEKSITALLRALEKLHIDNEKSISSGIWITVKNLLGHNSSRVQERAKALFDSWKQGRDNDAVHQDVEKVGACHDEDGATVSAKLAGESPWSESCAEESKGSANEGNLIDPARDEILPSKSPDVLQPERVGDVHIETSNNDVSSLIILDHADVKHGSLVAPGSSAKLDPVPESLPPNEEPLVCSVDGTTSVEACSSPIIKQSRVEGESDVSRLNEFSDDEKQTEQLNSSLKQLGAIEIPSTLSTVEPRAASSSADAANADKMVTEHALQNNIDIEEGDFCPEPAPLGDARAPMSEAKSEMDNSGVLNHCRNRLFFKSAGQGGECNSNVLEDTSDNEHASERPEDPETSVSRMEDIGAVDGDEEHDSDGGEDLTNASDFSRPAMGSDIGLEYDMVDALEVARQVAKAVEREVGDYREPFGSDSSGKISGGLIGQPGSPDSINGKQSESSEAQPREAPAGKNLSAESSPKGEGHLINSDNLVTKAENCIHDIESSQVTDAAQEPDVNPEKGMCDFDLNQEVGSEDMDRPVNPISTPVSVVSASRATAALGLPAAPLQFEGTLGWKGSAATSAFRPASPRKISDGDKGSSSSSKQRHDCLDIDLNVAEGGDDKNTDLALGKQIPVSSGLPSGESSVEASPRRSERPQLDLNLMGDDVDAPPSDWRMEGQLFYPRNGHRTPSPASSSSSMQPCMRNFDLNDRPSIHNDSEKQPFLGKSSSQYLHAYGGPKPVDPVISIMGTRVEVNRKDLVPSSFLPNGKAPELALDGNLVRTGGVLGLVPPVPFTHSPVFGYNGLTTGPAMSFSSPMYGPGTTIPYMVDSRGATVVPQIVGSASNVPASYSQPPFIMSLTSTPPGLNGAGPSRPNFDLNSGFVMEGGSRDLGGSRQLFIPGQGRLMEDHLRANSQPSSSSGIGGKRKEPDSGLETYPFNFKHQQPPWK